MTLLKLDERSYAAPARVGVIKLKRHWVPSLKSWIAERVQTTPLNYNFQRQQQNDAECMVFDDLDA